MAVSRQLRALGTISVFFAVVFAVVGTIVGVVMGGLVPATLALYAGMSAALGGMSGAVTALLVARSERGRSAADVPGWRLTLWGVLGGASPAALFGFLAITLGGGGVLVPPIVGLGVLGGGLGGVIGGVAAAAAKGGAVGAGSDQDLLPPE